MAGSRGKRWRRALSSASLPVVGGGLGWTTKPGDREVMHELFSRRRKSVRSLVSDGEMEGEECVNQSILNIRNFLSTALQRLPKGSASAPNVRSMRDACNAYLQATPGPQGDQQLRPHFENALWRWRQTVYEDVKSIANGLNLDEALYLLRDMKSSFG